MDDTRAKQTLDELADLFLTGADSSSHHVETVASEVSQPQRSRPFRLPPKPRHLESSAQTIDSREWEEDAFVAGTQPSHLKLAGAEDAETETNALGNVPESVDRALHVEAVVLGNLPGFSGPWLTQYADHVAQEHGPVAILHLDEKSVDFELVSPTDESQIARLTGDRNLDSLLAHLSQTQTGGIGAVLVHVPDFELSHVSICKSIRHWTVCSGSDDAAVVAGYSLLRQLQNLLPAWTSLDLGWMVLGSSEEQSREAFRKVQGASQSFLKAGVRFRGFRQRMQPISLHLLAGFHERELGTQLWDDLAQWIEAILEEETEAEASQVDSEAPRGSAEANAAMHTSETDQEIELAETENEPSRPNHRAAEHLPEVEPVVVQVPENLVPTLDESLEEIASEIDETADDLVLEEAPEPGCGCEQEVEATDGVEHKTEVPSQHETAQPVELKIAGQYSALAKGDQPDLVALLTQSCLPGALPLEARCPDKPGVALLLDESGVVHLAANSVTSDGGHGTSLQQTCLDLLAVRRWVRESIQLLAMTKKQCRFDMTSMPQLHLLTDDAVAAVGLSQRLDDTLHLHLLQQVTAGDVSYWMATSLSGK